MHVGQDTIGHASAVARKAEANRYVLRSTDVNLETLAHGSSRLELVLKQMGYTALRAGQEAPILNILGSRDTICVLPTGTGKTSVFAIPTLCLEWKTLVFSPLIALMRDQVKSMNRLGFHAGQMSTGQEESENQLALRDWMAGKLDLFYVAPERLRNAMFIEGMRAQSPDMVVLDEAHTLSNWSDNFRPDYCKVGDFIREYRPKVVAAFTATMPHAVEKDVRRVLGLGLAEKFVHYPRRTNLKLKSDTLIDIMQVAGFLREVDGPAIVYCGSIKNVEDVAERLSRIMPTEVTLYHGELEPGQKRTNMDLFMEGHARTVVATNAFGMGVDKSDVRGVLHYDMPGSIEALAQETGRAGRDGKDSQCLTLFSEKGLSLQNFFISNAYPDQREVEQVYAALCRAVGPDDTCQLTGDEIAKLAGISSFSMRAIISVMLGARVIDRPKRSDRTCKVRFEGAAGDGRFLDYKAFIQEGGVETPDGFLEVDLKWLTQRMQVGESTITKYLKAWESAKLLRYVPPFRGAPTKLIGDTSLIDFERLRQKERDARAKLASVVEYFQIPDRDKHGFIERHFDIENN
jgi:ATP-dependent DNA helicase RecQ